MIIIGIDPGTLITGYGIILFEDGCAKVIDFGCIKPPSKLKISDRYLIIFEAVDQLLERYKPDVLVVETQFMKKNVQSAIKLGMARGVVLIAAKKRGIPVYEYAPTQAKRAVVGNGHASKGQVQHMVKNLLKLDALPEPEDAADALSLALCHAQAHAFKSLCGVEI
jgi:crossover junction endodeoxyribonuclease RuvC